MSTSAPPAVPNYDDVWKRAYGEMQDSGPVHLHMRRLLRRMLGSTTTRWSTWAAGRATTSLSCAPGAG